MKRFIDAMQGFYITRQPLYNEDDPGGSGGSGGSDDEPDEKDDPGKRVVTMTQAELDALIGREKGRERKRFADYDSVKTRLAELEQAEVERNKAAMTEKERLEAEKAEAEKKATDAQEAGSRALEAANKRLINAEFKAVAREMNVRPDALEAALKLADLSGVTVDDEGNVVGVKEATQALVSSNPYLVEKPKPRQIGGGSGGDDRPEKTKEQLLAEAAEKARKSGRIEDQAAYAKLKRELGL